jgi:hypothetical protein
MSEAAAIQRNSAPAVAPVDERSAPQAQFSGPAPLRTIALAALYDLIDPAVDRESPFAAFLESAHRHGGGAAWPGTLSEVMASPADENARFVAATQRAGLSAAETLAVVIAIGTELDPAFARAVGWLQGSGGAARATVGLLAAAVAPLGGAEDELALQLYSGRVAQQQWLTFAGAGAAPLAQTEAQMPAIVLQALAGHPSPGTSASADAARLPLSDEQRATAARAARGLASRGGALIVRALDRREGLACAEVIARALTRTPMMVAERQWPAGFYALASIEPTLPIFDLPLAPGEQFDLPEPATGAPPLVIVTGLEGSVTVRGQYPPEMRLTIPNVAARLARWLQHGFTEQAAQRLASRLRCGCAQIDALARGAAFHAASTGAAAPSAEDVDRAMEAQGAANFDGVGRLIACGVDEAHVILSAPTRLELRRLRARCRVREHLGVDVARLDTCAVRALFAGPSGTGKTLAARWLATELALPLVAVDLAALTSKWVGETEKNLAQVFARAERTCAVLLFDEADSVFGARTDVSSANDRFANNQTNYLLQRIESYDGIIILTSNARQRLDSGFVRRLDAIVEFPLPGPAERRALWQLHLGSCPEAQTTVTAEEIDRFAGLVDLPGGHVRNAVLAARAMALAEGRTLHSGDVTLALRAEYNKLGRAVPADLHGLT